LFIGCAAGAMGVLTAAPAGAAERMVLGEYFTGTW